MTDYTLLKNQKTSGTGAALGKLFAFLSQEHANLVLAFFAMIMNSALNLAAPLLIGHAIDAFITHKNFHGVFIYGMILLGIYLVALVTGYFQTRLMGGVGQRMLFNLRGAVFTKLQDLPIGFFNQNKAGDLISRINNDTDKLNQFFSQSLMQFLGSLVTMVGAAIFLLGINWKLGILAIIPALVVIVITQMLSPWVKLKNAASLKVLGELSSEIQESLNNFKVVVAFNRRDYFRTRFSDMNDKSYATSVDAGVANQVFVPIYGLASNAAQLIIIAFGIHMIIAGSFTIGLLVSFIAYATNLYNPLRQLAALWTSFQTAMAGWDRIASILALSSDLQIVSKTGENTSVQSVMTFKNVSFGYVADKNVLHHINLELLPGKTYALVGPTGGGKTTTASLMARLYDPTEGFVTLSGQDIRTYSDADRTQKIGFILQEPFLFAGTLAENISYGNIILEGKSNQEIMKILDEKGLSQLLERFEAGLETKLSTTGEAVSLGQKQLIAFIRAVLREPELLILDEATANIDTVTEQLLDDILKKLPASTTRVIIAHRLNTIENADEIFFVNAGTVTQAGSMDHAVEMLLAGKRES